jgi:4-amino-4-deoxy-L-arabinose transferase-like glycosyltransferase
LQVTERRRATLVVLLLLIYPTFNIRGSSVTPDTLQAPFFVVAVLIFVIAYRNRKIRWAVLLGLICAGAVLTKYWALLLLSAIGVAALVDDERQGFFRSLVPYVAAATCLIVLTPHLLWLVSSDFAPFEYATRYLVPRDHPPIVKVGGALLHHFGMLLPVVLMLLFSVTHPRVRVPADWPVVRESAARQIWSITIVLIVVPPVLAILFGVYFVTDWGIPLYSLVPLAIVSIPSLGVPLRALTWAAAAWLAFVVVALAASPLVSFVEARKFPQRYVINGPDLADRITRLWHDRIQVPLPVIAGPKPLAAAISFYSPDHPVMFTNFDGRISPWINVGAIRQSGFVAICHAVWKGCDAQAQMLGAPLSKVEITVPSDRHISPLYQQSYTVFIAVPGG